MFSPVSVLAAQNEPTVAFKSKKDKAEKKLKEIESFVAKILKEKRVSKRADDLSTLLKEHVESLNDAVKQAIVDVEEAKKSEEKKGSYRSFVEFENMAVKHEKRGKAVEARFKNILAQIKEGDIELDGSLLKSMTPAERKDYLEYMTPSGREKMKKKQPKWLSAISVETDTKLVDWEKISRSAGQFCSATSEAVGDFLVPPAEAAIGFTAGTICGATGGAACFFAVVGLVAGFHEAYDEFVECLEGTCACKWYKPWCCTGPWACYVAYLVIVP